LFLTSGGEGTENPYKSSCSAAIACFGLVLHDS
jgi:hypothetical protein